MSIDLESKKRVDALITAANSKTGGNASDLTTAVGSLISGFGIDPDLDEELSEQEELIEEQESLAKVIASTLAGKKAGGGAGGDASGIYMAKVTPAEDMSELNVTHNLGTTDILCAVCWAETLGDVTPTYSCAIANFWAKTDIPQRINSSDNTDGFFDAQAAYNTANSYVTISGPNSTAYCCEITDENHFIFERAGSSAATWPAGITYTVIIIAASAFKETEE